MNQQVQKNKSLTRDYYTQLIFFVIAIVIINMWLGHHLKWNQGFTHVLSAFTIGYAIFTFLIGLGSEHEQSTSKAKIRRVLLYLLKSNILVTIYLIILLGGSSFSSITVYSGANPSILNVTIGTEDNDKKSEKILNGPSNAVNFLRYTTLFGKSFYIEVDGYMRESFELYPWIGKRIKIERDLKLSPSLLIRLPLPPNVFKGGYIIIIESADTVLKRSIDADVGSFVLGTKKTIPEKWRPIWQSYLEEKGGNMEYRATLFNSWNRTQHVKLANMKPGRELEIYCLNRREKPKAHKLITISNESFQDVLMEKTESP